MMDTLVSFGLGRSAIETTAWSPSSSFSFCKVMTDKHCNTSSEIAYGMHWSYIKLTFFVPFQNLASICASFSTIYLFDCTSPLSHTCLDPLKHQQPQSGVQREITFSL